MAKQSKYAGFAESRTRITIFLPASKPGHLKSLADIYVYLKLQRHSKRVQVLGYTKTVDQPPTFKGAWWGKEPGEPKTANDRWVFETVSQLIMDLDGDPDECRQFIKRFRDKILSTYKKYRCPQTDLWIIAHYGMRFDSV